MKAYPAPFGHGAFFPKGTFPASEQTFVNVLSKNLPDTVESAFYTATTGQVRPISVSYGDHPDWAHNPQTLRTVVVGGPWIDVKRVFINEDFIEKGKAGYQGSVSKDVIEACINEGNRYMANSNIFTQMFLGV